MPEIHRHKRFKKAYSRLSTKVREATKQRLELFASEPFNEVLHNHVLQGKYQGCRSINITGDFRIIYSEEAEGDILLINIGTHSQLYG